ncbi:MAG: GAF domain-containing protein [Deltaproteobacteria bacterium]|nr:GAF domain-containing protein [Deltaproteobacteria bacterium]
MPASRANKRAPAKGGKASDGVKAKQLAEQLKAVRAIGSALATSVGLDAVLAEIVVNVSKLMHAERTTLFLYDRGSNEIWSKIAEGEERREIRLKLGFGIAGWVAENRKALNVSDAYADPRFNPSVDAETGFRTRSVLAVPLLARDGSLLGVLQVLNRRRGTFGADDQGLLDAIAIQTAYAVENANLAQQVLDQNRELEAARQRAERRRAELDLLYQLEQETTASNNLDDLLDSIIVRTCERLRSEAGSVLLSDRDTGRLFFRGVSGARKDELKKMTLEPGEGVVGWVAKTGEPLVVNRPEDDPRHDRALAQKIAFPAAALLAVPLIWDQKVIGAMEVLNPKPRASGALGYDLEDLKVLTLIGGQVARAVALTIERQAKLDTERLAIIGRMLAGVAHDLRNPMTAISGYAQLMAMEPDAKVRAERCERVLAQIDEMTAMITDLLAFARGETQLNPTVVSVSQLADEAREAIGAHCNPRGIALDVDAKGGTVLIDVGRAKRILYNLAKNAVDVLAKGGHLSVRLAEDQGALSMQVSDTGPGIPAEVRARLFQPFVSSGKIHGTGLGLSIVKRFVDDHGGQIDVESDAGVGTSFKVRLPKIETRVS